MRLLIAIVFPFVSFFTVGRPFSALICLVLQVTLIGWLPAALWATYSLGQWRTDQKINALLVDAKRRETQAVKP